MPLASVLVHSDAKVKRHLAARLVVILVAIVLSGCSQPGEYIDDETLLQYNGPNRDAVIECVRALPEHVEAPDNPSTADVTQVTVNTEYLDDIKSRHTISGLLALDHEDRYSWDCDVSQRWFELEVTEVRWDHID
jgi:hypothetical protein